MRSLDKMVSNFNTIPAIPGTMPQFGDGSDDLFAQLAPLTQSLPDVAPPADLLASIEAELDAEPEEPTHVQRSDEGEWVQRADLIWKKILTRDPESGRCMYLLRCLPGARIKPHVHGRAEHLFIIEGEFWMNGKLFMAGDAQCSLPGTEHHEITMPNGCLVLVSA
ncbi:cupin domain-containing protein [Roseobacter sp. YSTF-M11]|uniref:Cupin domain-containing protein n=1 Tax=Roseobacter insulae TaxID=2859783 RepID=A0A9X1FU26_9RHOB|nr:cupin domain-containing protein [Roseobacter insulae]MBW4707419.1 cupin domain-containing protein [Roseobacter insulae]